MSDLPAWSIRLREERESRGWSLKAMARQLTEAADERTRAHLPTRESLVRMVRSWEAGKHRPRAPYPQLYARSFELSEAELFREKTRSADTRSGELVYPLAETHLLCETARTLGAASPIFMDAMDMERRAAVRLLAAVSAGTVIPAGALETVLGGVERALGERVDVDGWESTVQEYGELLKVRPVGSLIPDLTAELIAVGNLLNRGNPPLAQAGLARVGAEFGWMLASQLDDIGDQRAARVTWGTARRAADASGDRDLAVWVRSKEASMARWSSRPDTVALTLADEAIGIAGARPSRGLVQAYGVRASLAARRGESAAREAYTALDALEGAADQTGAARYLSWAQSYVYVLLGDSRASSAIDKASDGVSPEHAAEMEMLRALDLVGRRDVGEGLQQAVNVLGVRPASASRRHMTGEILTALPEKARTLPAARTLRALLVA
ncbi:hypothetical protein Ssi03_59360 [Sphaerisporangium siamense]|uniref:Transcriptional regulator with XRE-family HTH domain n=1 Tax=Sphaerisporangium siamense TaxID=795645 RepID=A0A7W7D454_9ACTN|nr:XRE family transcriptional regulator [Sphaerisporangium siamense]MBB4699766.1 transcriptional regulator with XRE-family HTH domain [Sphaerisporangium siamense]GII87946.1 hypothetical protein Ssi03_59360 [Sphaerisporangium siamense]